MNYAMCSARRENQVERETYAGSDILRIPLVLVKGDSIRAPLGCGSGIDVV